MCHMHTHIHHFLVKYYIDCIEMVKPIVEELKILEKEGVVVYDAFTDKEVLVIAPVLCVICDNPCASEITNTLGPRSRKFCRIFTVITLPLLYIYFMLH